jgi:hypothetical protein
MLITRKQQSINPEPVRPVDDEVKVAILSRNKDYFFSVIYYNE